MKLILCVFLLTGMMSLVEMQQKPGFKAQITSSGFQYANKVAMGIFSQTLKNKELPDQSKKDDSLSYTLSKLIIKKFTEPKASNMSVSKSGLNWFAKGADISMSGDFKYELKKLIVIKDSGSFDVDFSGISFDLTFKLGVNADGRPTIKTVSCDSSIDDVNVNFHGGAAWIYNILKAFIGSAIRKALDSKLCTLLENYFDNDGSKALARMKVLVPLGPLFTLDYKMIRPEAFNDGYLETFHKGEVYWTKDKKESPYQPPALPKSPFGMTRMMTIWMSNYIINTMMYQAHTHWLLTYNLTSRDLPPKSRGALNTTCMSSLCIGAFIKPLSQKYPNHTVEIRMSTTKQPNISVVSNQAVANLTGKLDFLVTKMITSKKQSAINVFTASAKMDTNVMIGLAEDQRIYSKPGNLSIKLKIEESKIGKIDEKALQFIVDNAVTKFVKPQLEALGKDGFPLPTTDTIKFTNTVLALIDNAFIISTDLQYTSPAEDKDSTLFFVSRNRKRH